MYLPWQDMAAQLLWLRASFSRFLTCNIPGARKTNVKNIICIYSTQQTQENPITRRIFQLLPREELVTKFKSRLKDGPFTIGSIGEGFPEFLGEPRESFPHGVRIINPHQSSLAQLTAKCMEYVEKNHAQHPAILFRGLPAETSQDFSTIVKEIPWNGMIYKGGTAFWEQVLQELILLVMIQMTWPLIHITKCHTLMSTPPRLAVW